MKSKINLGQSGKPNGIQGKVFGYIMSVFNQGDIEETIKELKLTSKAKVLEIGFGPGKAIERILGKRMQVKLFGIDHSETMVKMASHKNGNAIQSGMLNLEAGDVNNLQFNDYFFDIVFSINCIYFWQNPEQGLLEIKRVLKKSGKIIITVRNSTHGLNKLYNPKTLEQLYKKTGFNEIRVVCSKKRIICIGSK